MSIWNVMALLVMGGCLLWFRHKKRTALLAVQKKRKEESLPIQEVKNDRIIVMHCQNDEYVNRAITGLCTGFNGDTYQVICKLYNLGNHTYALLFPFGISFSCFCFATNYLQYPMDLEADNTATATGWTSLHSTDKEDEATQPYATGELMVYNPQDANFAGDGTFISTKAGAQHAFEFDLQTPFDESECTPTVRENYRQPEIELHDLEGREFKLFK